MEGVASAQYWKALRTTGLMPAGFEGRKGRGAMRDEGVIECFQKLSWDYKTNNPVKFGKRIIMRSVTRFFVCSYSPEHDATNTLDDLMRVFHLIDGKPEADHRNGCYKWISDVLKKWQ